MSGIISDNIGRAGGLVKASGGGGVVKQQVITLKQDFILLTGDVFPDDSIPQNTEGAELMTRAITPNDSANILVIEGIVNCGFTGNSASASLKVLSLFQDTTKAVPTANSK